MVVPIRHLDKVGEIVQTWLVNITSKMAAKDAPFKSFGIAWEDPTRTNNVYYYMNPIFINCHVLGCFPYDGKMRSSYFRIIMAVLFMFMMASTGAIYAYRSFGIPHSTTANAIVYMSIVVLALFCTLLVVFFTILQRKTLITVLDRIRAVDAKLLTMGVLYKYDRKEILSEIFLRWFFKTCMVVFDWIVYEQSISDICGPCLITSLYYSYFVIYNFQHQYTAIMNVVSRHLSLLNKYAVVHAGSKEIINRFIEIHYEFCEICQLVNEWFSPQLLFVCSLVFLATTLNLNAMFMALISFLDPLPPQITIFISSTFWVSARLYEMWEIFDVCTKTEQNV